MKRNMCAVYMDKEVYDVFRVYAVKKAPRKAYSVWEDALVEYMKSNPIDELRVTLQQIADILPNKREEVRMEAITRKLETFMSLIDKIKTNGGTSPSLKEKILTWAMRGTEIKNSTPEFVALIERALEYVKKD